jgi:hypothetical protein
MIARTPTPLERRARATQKLLDDWKDRPFDWKTQSHCLRLVVEHLRRMGYKPPLSRAGSFKSALAAKGALKRAKVKTLAEAVDLMGLPRIPPAAALVGDIIELPGEAPFGALTVAVGNNRVLGWHADADGAVVMQPVEYIAAWRVDPK